jgi:hypothetical protein
MLQYNHTMNWISFIFSCWKWNEFPVHSSHSNKSNKFTKSCWVTYYKSLCYIYNKIKYVWLHKCELCVPPLYMCVSMSTLLKTWVHVRKVRWCMHIRYIIQRYFPYISYYLWYVTIATQMDGSQLFRCTIASSMHSSSRCT